jgi:hypothetical protein
MFGSEGLKANGQLFAMHVRRPLDVTLSAERATELCDDGRAAPFDPGHGRLMKQWVAVAAGSSDWVALAREAHAFVPKQAARGRVAKKR